MTDQEGVVEQALSSIMNTVNASVFNYIASQEFESWEAAIVWTMTLDEQAPKYFVQKLGPNRWEAIQAWLRNF